MVRSGETAGNLDAVLGRLADFLDAQHALRAKVSGALTYPIIMVVLGSVVMGVLMVVVVPKITSIFEDLGKTLPWNTQLLIFVADVIGSYWWAVIIVAVGGYLLYRRWSRTARRGARSSIGSSSSSRSSDRWSASWAWPASRARWRRCWRRACRC